MARGMKRRRFLWMSVLAPLLAPFRPKRRAHVWTHAVVSYDGNGVATTYVNGRITDIQIWDTQLSSIDVERLARAGAGV